MTPVDIHRPKHVDKRNEKRNVKRVDKRQEEPRHPRCTQCTREPLPEQKLCHWCSLSKKLSRIRTVERRSAQGKCHLCEEPRTRGNHCEKHHEKLLTQQRFRLNQKPRKGPYHCSNCGEPGHNIASCPNAERF